MPPFVEMQKKAVSDPVWFRGGGACLSSFLTLQKDSACSIVAASDPPPDCVQAALGIQSQNPPTTKSFPVPARFCVTCTPLDKYLLPLLSLFRVKTCTQVGDLSLQAVHYGTSQSACGSLFQLSCGTVDGELFMTLQFAEPVVPRPTAQAYLQGIIDNLRAGCEIPA